MVAKAPSTLSGLVLTLSRACPRRRRVPYVPRRALQAIARLPSSRQASIPRPSNDDYLHALYEDLMETDAAATRVDSIPSQTAEVEPPSETVDILLAEHAKRGNTRDFELSISRMLSVPLSEHQRDLHVKVHIVNAHSLLPTTQRFPTGALAVLHQYEASGHFAPIKSYTRVISALFNVETCPSSDPRLGRAAARAQAWDLFAHMRYVAHPVPDSHLYALMIRACGSFSRPEPERALDLWMEMQGNGVKPTKGAYEAIIKVCGRAGPEWLGEGMKLAREMSDQYPITGANGKGLWCALLEGCKRAGDLKKARWILAEAVRDGNDGTSSKGSMVDAELMTHVFHTYASYQPPFRRETTRLHDHGTSSNGGMVQEESQVEKMSSHQPPHAPMEQSQRSDAFPDVPVENTESIPSFSRLPPQTSSDVIAETRALFDRVMQDRSLSLEESRHFLSGGLLVGKFAHVKLTSVLLNAYLSVFYRHASIETSREAFNSLFNGLSTAEALQADEYTYINALERCAMSCAEDRQIAAQWADDVWRRWEVIETNCLRDNKVNVGSFARLIERAHAAMRRVFILSGDVDGGLRLLRLFVSQYPPNAVLYPASTHLTPVSASLISMPAKPPSESTTIQLFAKPPILSTRTVLTNPAASSSLSARPLVRLTSAVNPTDDRIPPVIGFGDVDLLHARLAEHGRIKDLGYVKWVCMAYTGALKKRRDAVLKAATARHEEGVD